MCNYCARGLSFYLQLTDYDKQFVSGVWPLFLISHRSSKCNQKFEQQDGRIIEALLDYVHGYDPAELVDSKRNYSEGLRDSSNGDGHRQSRVAVRYDFCVLWEKGKWKLPVLV